MGKRITSLKGLLLEARRFRDKITKIGKKITRNPHRGDYVPSVDSLKELSNEMDILIKKADEFKAAHAQFQWDMYEARDLLKSLLQIALAQKEIMEK